MLQGRRVIVTGGAQGIGAALVNAYVEAGARVGYLDNQDRCEHHGAPNGDPVTDAAAFSRCDVTVAASVDAAFSELTDVLDGLDVLVHLAAIMLHAKAEEITADDWQRQMTVNTLGTLLTNQAAFRHLKNHGGASSTSPPGPVFAGSRAVPTTRRARRLCSAGHGVRRWNGAPTASPSTRYAPASRRRWRPITEPT